MNRGLFKRNPFYLEGKSLISKHPSSKNTSEYAADSTYYDNIINKFGDPSKRFNAQRNAINNLLKQYELQFDKQGGKLNKYLKGKKILPTAPKAEDRYKNGYKYGSHLTVWSNGDGINRSGVASNNKIQYGRFPAIILRDIRENSNDISNLDTTYYEVPSFTSFPILFLTLNPLELSKSPALIKPKIKIRQASSKDKNRSEYETLKRRFNTAWNLAK